VEPEGYFFFPGAGCSVREPRGTQFMWTRLIGNNNPTLHTFSPVCRTFSATIYAHYLDDDLSLSVFVIELVCMIMGTIYYLRPSKAVLLTQQFMICSLKQQQQQLRPLRFCVERERETVQMHTLLSDKLLGRIPELVIMLSVNPLKETKVLQDIIRTLY
jgi:hypothetical protein